MSSPSSTWTLVSRAVLRPNRDAVMLNSEASALLESLVALAASVTGVADEIPPDFVDAARETRNRLVHSSFAYPADVEAELLFLAKLPQRIEHAAGMSRDIRQRTRQACARLESVLIEMAERLPDVDARKPRLATSARRLQALLVRVLPPNQRDRYLEEFRGETLDTSGDSRWRQLRYTCRVASTILALRRSLREMPIGRPAREPG